MKVTQKQHESHTLNTSATTHMQHLCCRGTINTYAFRRGAIQRGQESRNNASLKSSRGGE